MAKKALALIVGNANYPGHALRNAVNDANDLTAKLRKLGFVVRTSTDVTVAQFDSTIDWFGDELNNYDVGLFFFAGHGLQIQGENFLTAIDTNFHSPSSVKYSAVHLDKVLSVMESATSSTSIIILDACRDNPYVRSWSRGTEDITLAPIHAPKGTIIAFATSPGEKASDGVGNNGLYTTALLKHLDDENIPIEELFKRVRITVSAFSSGKQTSWEHTSLTGPFFFNTGQIISVTAEPYTEKAIADKNYQPQSRSIADTITEGLKSYSWGTQNAAISKLSEVNPQTETPDALFVLGRNILQSAVGNAFSVQDIIVSLQHYAERFTVNGANHLVNGILFEVYFDSDGKFRYDRCKVYSVNAIFDIQNNLAFKSSVDFIQTQLKPFSDYLFAIPSVPPQTISLNIISEKKEEEHIVNSIIFEGREVLHAESQDSFFANQYEPMRFGTLKHKISNQIIVPVNQITFNTNENLSDDSPVRFPYGRTIKKQ